MKFKKNISVLLCVTMLLTSVRIDSVLGEDNEVNSAVMTETITEILNEETTNNYLEESTEESKTQSVVETMVESSSETLSVVVTTENSTVIIEEAKIATESDVLFGDVNISTNSDLNDIDKENKINDLSKPDDTKKPAKKRIDGTKNHLNVAKPAGFTVDVVKRDDSSNAGGLYGSGLNLPIRYDSREHQNAHGVDIIPPIKDQGNYGTCWACASIGAVETSLRAKNIITSESDPGAKLSETALALFVIEGLEGVTDNNAYIDYPGVESADYNCINYDYYMNVQHVPRASMSFAESGGNEISAYLMMSTHMSLVPEYEFPYTEANIEAIKTELRTTGLDNSRKPYAFNRNVCEILNVDFLSRNDRASIKEAIMEQGSVSIGYYESRDNCNCHEDNGEWYYLAPLKACKIEPDGSCGEEISLGQNHAVTIVGWDDSIPRDKFYFDGEIYENRTGYDIASYSIIDDDSGLYYPTYENASAIHSHSDGAWLIRNSWGDIQDMHRDGYFWLPYDTLNFDDVVCAVEAGENDTYLYNYHYDTTADKSTYNYLGAGKLANVFQVSHDIDQVLDAVNIAWQSANFDYEIYIYTNENQMSNPEDGTLMLSQTVHNAAAGIKTVPLNKSVLLPKDTYFSIIVKPNSNNISIFSEYSYADSSSDKFFYDEIQYGESWENDDGTWRDMNAHPPIIIGDKKYGSTPRIRGLTDEARVITFDPGVATGSMAKQGMKLGSTGQINSNEFTYDGHVFYKWIDNNGNEYDDGANITLNDNITLTAEWQDAPPPAPTPTPTPSPSGGDSGGSGGSSGGPIPENVQVLTSIEVIAEKGAMPAIDASTANWVYDPNTNKFRLNVDINGQKVPASNGFFTLNEVETKTINNVQVPVPVQNTYYFDGSGAMVTGWVHTSTNNKWYFFETAKTKDEGKMVVGWKKIVNDWYFFTSDGSMLINSITPDGYYVGVEGKFKYEK